MLLAEGYIETRHGSGSYVAGNLQTGQKEGVRHQNPVITLSQGKQKWANNRVFRI